MADTQVRRQPLSTNVPVFLTSRCPNPKCEKLGTIRRSIVKYKDTEYDTSLRICTRCGWEAIDAPMIPSPEVCAGGDCGAKIGKRAHRADQTPDPHYCADCSTKRLATGAPEPGALTDFEVLCADGCGTPIGFIAFPEGKYDKLPDTINVGRCDDCVAKALAGKGQ